ncbi:MAG: guanine deaminase [Roseibium sp.]
MVEQRTKLLRGRILSFKSEPEGPEDTSSFDYIEDGALLVGNGKILTQGTYHDVKFCAPVDVDVIDHRPHLLLPGFIDTHLHFPQVQVIASWADQLLDWLNDYTFPAELKFEDKAHGAQIAEGFYDVLLSNGTTTAVAYCSSHPNSVDAYFEEAAKRSMLMVGGKTMMDRNAPAALCDTAQSAYDDSKALAEKWHGNGRAHYAITPRFAITSTPEQLEAAGALLKEIPDCHLQTHINENHNEIAFTKELFPKADDYLGVYEKFELLGAKTLLGHCIHMNDRELGVMKETGSVAVFCPTSNLFLGSGLFDKKRLQVAGVRTAIATDIGGGTSYSMLRTMDEGYKILQMQRQRQHPYQTFYWSTLGNAKALSLSNKIGTLDVGSDADIIVLDARATRPMALRMETVETLWEELFVLQTLGDDRAVVETYIAGNASKPEN